MSTRTIAFRVTFLLLTVVTVVAHTPPATAVPLWTRRYSIDCSACHAFPGLQLTSMGVDFLRRGHRMEGDTFDKDITHLVSAHGEWEYEARQGESTAFTQPEFHGHSGGAVSALFSFYVDVNLNSDFESSYLQITKAWNEDLYFTARGGKISPTIIRNYGNGLMASASAPLVLTETTLGNNPFVPARDSYGVNVGARLKALYLEGGATNGDDVPGQAAVDNHKDAYATAEFATKDGLTGVGLYSYRGGYDLGDTTAGFLFDRYDRNAVFANLTRDAFRIAGAFVYGKDRVDTIPDRTLRGYFVQLDGHPSNRWAPFVRYDDVTTETEAGRAETRKGTLGCAAMLYKNDVSAARAVLEVARAKEVETSVNSALLNLNWAF